MKVLGLIVCWSLGCMVIGVTPFAKDLGIPNVSQIVPSLIELTDDKGAEKEHVKVKIYKA